MEQRLVSTTTDDDHAQITRYIAACGIPATDSVDILGVYAVLGMEEAVHYCQQIARLYYAAPAPMPDESQAWLDASIGDWCEVEDALAGVSDDEWEWAYNQMIRR